MKISKRSWHYRLFSWLNGDPPQSKNLCQYCRNLTLLSVFWLVFYAGCVVASPILLWIWFWKWFGAYLDKKFPQMLQAKPREPKTLAGAWIKAEKDRVCPVLEWVD